jgi:hypothetical protein
MAISIGCSRPFHDVIAVRGFLLGRGGSRLMASGLPLFRSQQTMTLAVIEVPVYNLSHQHRE